MEVKREYQILSVNREAGTFYAAIGYYYEDGRVDWTNMEYDVSILDTLLWPIILQDGIYNPGLHFVFEFDKFKVSKAWWRQNNESNV